MAGAPRTSTELAIEAAAVRPGAPLHTHAQSQSKDQRRGFVAVEVIVSPTTTATRSWSEQQQQLFHDTCVLTWLFPGFIRAIGECTAILPGLGRSHRSATMDSAAESGPDGSRVGDDIDDGDSHRHHRHHQHHRGVYAFRMARAAGLRGRVRAAFEEHVVAKANMNPKPPPFSLKFTPLRPRER